MTAPATIRLMGPSHRRIVELDMNSEKDHQTHVCLTNAGWRHYEGPGTTNGDGWYVGDDPAVPFGGLVAPRQVT